MDLPSNDPTTLRAFDMAVAISEEALNKQLDLLYHTPVKTLPLPQPGTTQPKQEYLIKHDVSMHYPETDPDGNVILNEDGSALMSASGIDGWIAPPTITINPRSKMSSTVTIKFIKNPDPNATGNVDTTYTYLQIVGRTVQEKKIIINDWSISWDCDLKSTEIQAIQEELLALALPHGTVKKLSDHVQNESFLVSSIFCLMEAVKITNTFRIADSTGSTKPVGTWTTSFILALCAWLGVDNGIPDPNDKDGTKKKKLVGLPTPRNPFVLGYGIYQKLPPSPGVPLFNPLFFQFSTSADEPGAPKSPASSTLNFCIKTRDKKSINTHADGNAGNFTPSLMQKVGLQPAEADGVMVISNGLMFDEVLKKYFIDPFHVVDFYNDAKKFSERHTDDAGNSATERSEVLGKYRVFKKAIFYDGPRDSTRTNMLVQEKTNWFVWENFQVTLDSDPAPTKPHDGNIQRRAFVTVRAQHMMQIRLETSPRGSSNWSDASNAYAWVNLRFRYMLTPTDTGSWVVRLVESDPKVNPAPPPPVAGQPAAPVINIIRSKPGRWPDMVHGDPQKKDIDGYDYGVYFWGDREGFFSVSGDTGLSHNEAIISELTMPDVGKISEALTMVTTVLNSKVIMPAGNVFSFKGLNVDEKGNVYSGITYNSLTDGERFVPGEVARF